MEELKVLVEVFSKEAQATDVNEWHAVTDKFTTFLEADQGSRKPVEDSRQVGGHAHVQGCSHWVTWTAGGSKMPRGDNVVGRS